MSNLALTTPTLAQIDRGFGGHDKTPKTPSTEVNKRDIDNNNNNNNLNIQNHNKQRCNPSQRPGSLYKMILHLLKARRISIL